MRSARLDLALASGIFDLPPQGRMAIYRPQAGDDLSALPQDRVTVLTGFFPDHAAFAARGYATTPAAPYAAALICLPRARDHARALVAQATVECLPGAPVLVDGQKTDGIEAMIRELRGLVPVSEPVTKAHGKLVAIAADPAPFTSWAAGDRQIEGGFITRPGVFSADAPDRGSMLLAQALPDTLGPKVVDLGAGWGYLSRAILARKGVKRLDLVEAEAEAVTCAKANIQDDRARFHWVDATTFRPETLAETVVTNPPFHASRAADPGLGAAFIAAARRMLAPDGVLYLVANRHLPYDQPLSDHFLSVETIGGDAAFRLILAAKPRRPVR